jgi:hypothetical protein
MQRCPAGYTAPQQTERCSGSTPELGPTVPVENLPTNEVFDTTTGKWSALRPMLTALNYRGALIDSRTYVVDGRVGSTFIIELPTNVARDAIERQRALGDRAVSNRY